MLSLIVCHQLLQGQMFRLNMDKFNVSAILTALNIQLTFCALDSP